MTHRFRATLGAALLLCAAGAGAYTVNELVAKNVEAKGGAAALAAVKSLRRSGKLIVGGSTIPGAYVLPPLISSFKNTNPGISVQLSIDDTAKIARMKFTRQSGIW